MLTHISIKGLAIIESLEISFSRGFNVITGETGAGKSILIKALNLLLGAKAGEESLRKGSDQATISGTFELDKSHPAAMFVQNLGIPSETDRTGNDTLIIRRTFTSKGRFHAWVNDISITGKALKELGSMLIDIFGQRDNHKLLDTKQHTHYLDAFLTKKNHLATVQQSHGKALEVYRQLRNHIEQFEERLRNRDYLQYRLSELDEFSPSTDDYNEIFQLAQNAAKFHRQQESVSQIQEYMDSDQGLARPIWEVEKLLEKLSKDIPTFSELAKRANELAATIDDLCFDTIREIETNQNYDESGINAAEDRLAGYQDLFRKLAVDDIGELESEQARLKEELDFLQTAEQQIKAYLNRWQQTCAELTRSSDALSKERVKASKKIKQLVESELHELAMPGSRFEVGLSPVIKSLEAFDDKYFDPKDRDLLHGCMEVMTGASSLGAEVVQFLLSSNPGEPAFPLNKIASGGEMSRIMLALKRSLAGGADCCLLVFDEIDTGISGKVADIVGTKLKDLGGNFQVLCVSHLPQVAAYADTHFCVSKEKKGSRTESKIVELTQKQSLEEIARLLSGEKLTPESINNAKTLVNRAQKTR